MKGKVKIVVIWADGIKVVFTNAYEYADYCERVLESGEYCAGYDYIVDEIYEFD